VGSVFCPYDSVSAFALEPSYICLRNIPAAKDLSRPSTQVPDESIQDEIKSLKIDFPAAKLHVDYALRKKKMHLLQKVFLKAAENNSAEFQKFKGENAYWLHDFALYKALKEFHQQAAWFDWQDKYKYRDKQAIESFSREHEKEMVFQMWVQWQLYLQFKQVKEYASSKNVFIKGDLPILVSRDSADVWQHPEFFKLEFAAGAPPDMYCAKGQRWGMPTYNWEQIQADGFRYIAEKLKYADNFYDILRIDHVVGIFRIWSIPYNDPLENQGLNGFFDPGDESRWGGHGRNILNSMMNNTKALLCAEDLGIIPRVCTDTIKELGIPGNDVQRWVKDWDVRHDFLRPQEYRSLSVAMLSTHDTTNWPAWWENEAGTVDEALFMRKCNDRRIDYERVKKELFDPPLSRHGRLRWRNSVNSVDKFISILGKRYEEVKDFIDMYQNTFQEKEKLWKHFGFSGPMKEKSDTKIAEAALEISLNSNAIFCINTIFDWLYLTDLLKGDSYQYRINTPGTISNKNWSLTIPLSLEELLKHKINKKLRSLVAASGRTQL